MGQRRLAHSRGRARLGRLASHVRIVWIAFHPPPPLLLSFSLCLSCVRVVWDFPDFLAFADANKDAWLLLGAPHAPPTLTLILTLTLTLTHTLTLTLTLTHRRIGCSACATGGRWTGQWPAS